MRWIATGILGLALTLTGQEPVAIAQSAADGKTFLANEQSRLVKEVIQKKRAAPETVPPVVHAGVRYEVVHWGKGRGLPQNGGYLAAIDQKSDEELWLLKVYEVHYDGDMEDDKQDVFITSLTLSEDGKYLHVKDERDRRYTIDIKSRKVNRP